uniref:Uncharacterized protein n=1 Tax=Kalanchoe fedtschenkoi TaxID=63787 RepID=A0A7N0V9V8_KALFE
MSLSLSLSQSLLCNFYRSAQKSVFCNSIVSGRFFAIRVPVVESTATSLSRSISDQTMPHRKQKRRDSEQVWKLKHEEVFTSSQRPASVCKFLSIMVLRADQDKIDRTFEM